MERLFSDRLRNQLRQTLQETTDARVCRRCGALLSWDDGKPVPAVAREFGVTRQTLYNWRAGAGRFRSVGRSPPLRSIEEVDRPVDRLLGRSIVAVAA